MAGTNQSRAAEARRSVPLTLWPLSQFADLSFTVQNPFYEGVCASRGLISDSEGHRRTPTSFDSKVTFLFKPKTWKLFVSRTGSDEC